MSISRKTALQLGIFTVQLEIFYFQLKIVEMRNQGKVIFKLILSENVLDTDKNNKFLGYRVNLVLIKL